MEAVIAVLKTASLVDATVSVLLIAIICGLAMVFYKEIKKQSDRCTKEQAELHEKYQQKEAELHEKYQEQNDRVIKQMFQVVDKNTEASTKLCEAVKELSFRVK